jgi:arylsulfatase A-like enzyme
VVVTVPAGISRVIVLVVDGLRADAIPLYQLRTLQGLADAGASTLAARTVAPSVTAAAMTSLLTGVAPATHGILSDRFGIPRDPAGLVPLPAWLRRHGVQTRGFMASLPRGFRALGSRIGARLEADLTFVGRGATPILDSLLRSLDRHRAGCWICHWPDADLAGHRDGWTSRAYQRATEEVDRALARLLRGTGVRRDPETVLVVMADHGGGGRHDRAHDSGHPLDTTIPILIAGGQVARGPLAPDTSLLDVPATVPWLLGLPTPPDYQGRVLVEAFAGGLRHAPPLRAVA